MAPKVKNNTVYTMVESPTKTTGINTGKNVCKGIERSMENMNSKQKITQKTNMEILKPNRTQEDN